MGVKTDIGVIPFIMMGEDGAKGRAFRGRPGGGKGFPCRRPCDMLAQRDTGEHIGVLHPDGGRDAVRVSGEESRPRLRSGS